ncbi:MAG TPA: glutaredoxin, partial [Alcanivorax sp.]|nr:glutaredoxin [Alcanivorax sp.]
MADVTLYSTGWCPFCVRAKRLLAGNDARVHEIDVDREPEARREMMARSGRRTV